MKKNTISLLSIFFLFAFALSSQPAQDSNVGAVIVAALEGKVSVLKNNDDQQGAEVKPGDVIPLGKMIVTGSGSKAHPSSIEWYSGNLSREYENDGG
jgi:hypothetical protein